jgi:hypothetical protein
MNAITKTLNLLPFFFALVIGVGIGSMVKQAQNQQVTKSLTNALEKERVMSLGAMSEIMAWESFYLRQKGLSPEDYACRFTDEFNPAHSANPSTEENIDAMLSYAKSLKGYIGNEPQCYSFDELRKEERRMIKHAAN